MSAAEMGGTQETPYCGHPATLESDSQALITSAWARNDGQGPQNQEDCALKRRAVATVPVTVQGPRIDACSQAFGEEQWQDVVGRKAVIKKAELRLFFNFLADVDGEEERQVEDAYSDGAR